MTSLKNLNSVAFKYLVDQKNLEHLLTNVKHIKIFNSCYYYNLRFIENAVDKKFIVNSLVSYLCGEINHVEALSVFSSLHFKMHKMTAIKDYVESNGGAINTVTSVEFDIVFKYQSIKNIIKLLTYFPSLDSVKVHFNSNRDESIKDDRIHQLYSDLQIKGIKKSNDSLFSKKRNTCILLFHCSINEALSKNAES